MSNDLLAQLLQALGSQGVHLDVILPDGRHVYWSTYCRHATPEGHRACRAIELAPGVARRPAQCKTCAAPCVCPCHLSNEDPPPARLVASRAGMDPHDFAWRAAWPS